MPAPVEMTVRELGRPEDVEFFLNGGEVLVAGGEGGFAIEGEGGGEAVDVGEIEVGFEFGSVAREFDVGGDQMDRELGKLLEKMAGESRALVAPHRIVRLAPIDDAHEKFALAVDGKLQELFDLFSAGTVHRKGHDGAGVENDALHGMQLIAELLTQSTLRARRAPRRATQSSDRGASQFSLSVALLKEIFEGLGVLTEAAAEATDEFGSERLENETVFLFDEGHLGTFFDGVLAAKLGRDDQLAFGGDGGDFSFHARSLWRKIQGKYTGMSDVSQLM
jgi:hypothetical protein